MLTAATEIRLTNVHPFPQRDKGSDSADSLAFIGTSMRFPRNSEIYGEDEPAEYLYQLVSGTVRIVKVLADGRRQISAFHFAGESFGLEEGETHQFSAEAITDCLVLMIRRRAALELAEKDVAVGRQLWLSAVHDLARAREHMMLLARKTATERVAAFLFEMSKRAGKVLIELPMSRYDIADHLGLTIETVSRTFTELDKSGAIHLLSARRLEIARTDALRRLAA